jgi:uncharacterized glyoxalase superfamily protein PhnB
LPASQAARRAIGRVAAHTKRVKSVAAMSSVCIRGLGEAGSRQLRNLGLICVFETPEPAMPAPDLLSSTPVLFVESVAACLDFWVRRLSFEQVVEVPHGDEVGFVILQRGELQVMLQSYASGAGDVPALAEAQRLGPTFLFLKVADIDAIEQALAGIEVLMPRRTTFYGAVEIGYREPGGHVVTFAQFVDKG